jgi:hypothetical protein
MCVWDLVCCIKGRTEWNFMNKVLGKIFRRKREEGTADWRKLHDE